MMKRMLWHLGMLLAIFVLSSLVGSGSSWAGGDDVRRRASLEGDAIGGLVPEGQADFRDRMRKNRRRFSVEVSGVNLEPGTELNVLWLPSPTGSVKVCTTDAGLFSVGMITLEECEEAEEEPGAEPAEEPAEPNFCGDLNLDSRDGDDVPAVNEGDIISVCQADGTPVVAGTLANKRRRGRN